MKKKTPKTKHSPTSKDAPASTAAIKDEVALDPDLPIIKILSEEEELFVKMELEMDDKTHDMLVKWGKEVASDEDYINIAITDGLKHHIHRADATH